MSVLYFSATVGLSLLVPRRELDLRAPFPYAFWDRGVHWMKYVAAVGTLLATSATKVLNY